MLIMLIPSLVVAVLAALVGRSAWRLWRSLPRSNADFAAY
jgi:hypothetical protein